MAGAAEAIPAELQIAGSKSCQLWCALLHDAKLKPFHKISGEKDLKRRQSWPESKKLPEAKKDGLDTVTQFPLIFAFHYVYHFMWFPQPVPVRRVARCKRFDPMFSTSRSWPWPGLDDTLVHISWPLYLLLSVWITSTSSYTVPIRRVWTLIKHNLNCNNICEMSFS